MSAVICRSSRPNDDMVYHSDTPGMKKSLRYAVDSLANLSGKSTKIMNDVLLPVLWTQSRLGANPNPVLKWAFGTEGSLQGCTSFSFLVDCQETEKAVLTVSQSAFAVSRNDIVSIVYNEHVLVKSRVGMCGG